MHAFIAYNVYMKCRQYTIRNIPDSLDSEIRRRARKTHKSMNAVLINALSRGIGLTEDQVQYHDLDGLVGSWIDDPEFDAAMEAFEAIDEDMWK